MLEALSSLLGIQATGVAKSREKIAVGGQEAGGFSLERGVELSCFPAGAGHHGLGSHVVTSEETSGWRDTLGDPHGGRLGRAKAVTGTGRACKWSRGVTAAQGGASRSWAVPVLSRRWGQHLRGPQRWATEGEHPSKKLSEGGFSVAITGLCCSSLQGRMSSLVFAFVPSRS